MRNHNGKISWTNMKSPKEHWVRDSRLSVKTSDLIDASIKCGLSYGQVERVLQTLGMNIEDWHLQLIHERMIEHKPGCQ